MTRLLFTGGGGAGSEALYRLLSARYDVHFCDAEPDARPHGVPAGHWHTVPMASDPAFVDSIWDLCERLGVDVLVPGVDEELLPIAGVKDGMACETLLPPQRFIATHLDKLTSNDRLWALGVPAPSTELLAHQRRVQFPCIVKPRSGRGSRNVGVAHSWEEAMAYATVARTSTVNFIAQELLVGTEYSVTVAADLSGVLRAVVPVRCEFKRGISIRAETDDNPAVVDACVKIHEADPVPGCYNIQVIETENGVKPFEINPRISSTACLVYAAGVDFVGLFLDESAAGVVPFRNGLRLRRSWYNDFQEAA